MMAETGPSDDQDSLGGGADGFDMPEFLKPRRARRFDMPDGSILVGRSPLTARPLFAARQDISLFPLHLIPIRGDDVDRIAHEARLHGHDDWRAPMPDELAMLHACRARVRIFSDHWYWSAATAPGLRGALRFSDGLYHPHYLRRAEARLRLVRSPAKAASEHRPPC